MHVFGQWEEAVVPGENPRIHGENMLTPHRKAPGGYRTCNPSMFSCMSKELNQSQLSQMHRTRFTSAQDDSHVRRTIHMCAGRFTCAQDDSRAQDKIHKCISDAHTNITWFTNGFWSVDFTAVVCDFWDSPDCNQSDIFLVSANHKNAPTWETI